jgi:tetratricopeptide (TPR) repeat protein
MIVRSNIGEVLMTLGRLPEAIDNLSEVVFANKGQGGLIGVAGLAHVNLSRCYLASGDTKLASRHSWLGKRLLSQAGQAGLVAEAELHRAEVLLAEGRADLAANAARTGLRQARGLGARLLEARGQRVLGEALAAQERMIEAGDKIRDSVSIARRIEATHEEALSLVSLARLSLQVGTSRARVVAHLRRAEKILGRMGARIEVAEAKRLLEEALA